MPVIKNTLAGPVTVPLEKGIVVLKPKEKITISSTEYDKLLQERSDMMKRLLVFDDSTSAGSVKKGKQTQKKESVTEKDKDEKKKADSQKDKDE